MSTTSINSEEKNELKRATHFFNEKIDIEDYVKKEINIYDEKIAEIEKDMTWLSYLNDIEERGIEEYKTMENINILPFDLCFNSDKSALILKYKENKKNKVEKIFSLMKLLSTKQQNFLENFNKARNIELNLRKCQNELVETKKKIISKHKESLKKNKSISKKIKKISLLRNNSWHSTELSY